MTQKKRNPSVGAGVSKSVNVLAGPIDEIDTTTDRIALQAERLRRRFVLSPALARATAELMFASRRRFA